jgi:tRNA(Ile)-lysidine synthase
LGLGAHVLRDRKATPPMRNIQAELRALRYRLLVEACAKFGIADLFLGHTLDDQAETFLQRLARGSGVDGLAAMLPSARHGALNLRRPLLEFSRERLRATLRTRGEIWIDDPSNVDPRHGRARWRRLMPALAEEGLTRERLARTAGTMARASEALRAAAAALIEAFVIPEPFGSFLLDPAPLRAADQEIGLRALGLALRAMAGGPPLRLDRLMHIHGQLIAGLTRPCTVHGCRILPFRNGLRVVRELRGAAGPLELKPGQRLRFDHRFEVKVARNAPPGLRIEVLGRERWQEWAAKCPDVPALVGPTLPAVLDSRGVRALPLCGVFRSDRGAKEVMIAVTAPNGSLDEREGALGPACLSACLEGAGY